MSGRGVRPPAIEFDDVHFHLPGRLTVLSGVSFTVAAGSRTALVGPSGCGKSTVSALLARFYEPQSGVRHPAARDRPIRDLTHEEVRRHLAMVEQDAPAGDGSLRDNVSLGAVQAADDELLAVPDDVELAVLVPDPAALDRSVGDDGVTLSGGQRQRLSWARAMLYPGDVLLLDEPTSSLDAHTEWRLQQLLGAGAPGRTRIAAAHRLITVRDSDQIVVLDCGRGAGDGHARAPAGSRPAVPAVRPLPGHGGGPARTDRLTFRAGGGSRKSPAALGCPSSGGPP